MITTHHKAKVGENAAHPRTVSKDAHWLKTSRSHILQQCKDYVSDCKVSNSLSYGPALQSESSWADQRTLPPSRAYCSALNENLFKNSFPRLCFFIAVLKRDTWCVFGKSGAEVGKSLIILNANPKLVTVQGVSQIVFMSQRQLELWRLREPTWQSVLMVGGVSAMSSCSLCHLLLPLVCHIRRSEVHVGSCARQRQYIWL